MFLRRAARKRRCAAGVARGASAQARRIRAGPKSRHGSSCRWSKKPARVDAPCSSVSYFYILAHSKTNQAGVERPEDIKPLVGRATVALAAWLAASGIKEGALFRRIRKGGHLGEPLALAAVCDIVKERCALAGFEGRFSAHSLRAGFVTEAGRQAMSLPKTMA
jgi:hypothetical protein